MNANFSIFISRSFIKLRFLKFYQVLLETSLAALLAGKLKTHFKLILKGSCKPNKIKVKNKHPYGEMFKSKISFLLLMVSMNILVTRKVYEQMSKFFNTNGTFALVEDDTLNLSSTRK